jgi:sugar phosphate isomerase/epimerase
MSKLKIAVQLYTIRDHTEADFAKALQEVAKIGYKYVELAGFGNLKSAADVKKALDDAGLVAIGSHAGTPETYDSSLSQIIDDAKTIGYSNVLIPWVSESWRGADGYRKLAANMTKHGTELAKHGLKLAYHNHSFEFEKYEGVYGLDILWQHSDAKIVRAELDLFWVNHGGLDVLSYVNQVGSRTISLHLKDASKIDKNKFANVGTGTIDFASIIPAAEKLGVEYGAVEQDDCYGQPTLESIKISYENLAKMGWK